MKKTSFFLIQVFISLIGFAQNEKANSDTVSRLLDEVVVTAHRHQQKNLLVPYSIGTLSKEYLFKKPIMAAAHLL